MTTGEPHRRGRRRSEESQQAILTAAFDLVAENSQDFTMEGIAARAGVSKQTIYRWWPTKGDILLESLAARAETHVSTADHGSYTKDLRHFLDQTFELLRLPGVRNALRSLMGESQRDPALMQRFREGFLERRRIALGHLVTRAESRGDLPASVRGELIGDVVFGVVWYRMLATERLLGDADAKGIAALLSSTA
jgi:AcrR family transcriptional regulator